MFSKGDEQSEECRDERVRTAACVILLEVAGADDEFSPEECRRVLEALRRRFGISQEEAEELLETAQAKSDAGGGLFRYTSEINACCSPEEKQRIIEEAWRVIYADGALDAHEDYVVHKLARLLNLTHPQLIEAKMKVRREIDGKRAGAS